MIYFIIIIIHQDLTVMNLYETKSMILKCIRNMKRNCQIHNDREVFNMTSKETYRSDRQKSKNSDDLIT